MSLLGRLFAARNAIRKEKRNIKKQVLDNAYGGREEREKFNDRKNDVLYGEERSLNRNIKEMKRAGASKEEIQAAKDEWKLYGGTAGREEAGAFGKAYTAIKDFRQNMISQLPQGVQDAMNISSPNDRIRAAVRNSDLYWEAQEFAKAEKDDEEYYHREQIREAKKEETARKAKERYNDPEVRAERNRKQREYRARKKEEARAQEYIIQAEARQERIQQHENYIEGWTDAEVDLLTEEERQRQLYYDDRIEVMQRRIDELREKYPKLKNVKDQTDAIIID